MERSTCSSAAQSLLQALTGISRAVASLYGPSGARKLIHDDEDEDLITSDALAVVRALHSENAAGAILMESLERQQLEFGSGCGTIVSLCGVLADAALDLVRQGFTGDAIYSAFARAEEICLQTLQQMSLPLNEVIPSFQNLPTQEQLVALSAIVNISQTGDGCDEIVQLAAPISTEALVLMGGSRCKDQSKIDAEQYLTTHCLHGSCSVRASSQAISGILLPVEFALRDSISHLFKTHGSSRHFTGVVALSDDLKHTQELMDMLRNLIEPWKTVQVVFVHGIIDAQVMDANLSIVIIPVASYKLLTRLADMSGASIIKSWSELLPIAVGLNPVIISRFDVTIANHTAWRDDDELSDIFLRVVGTREPHANLEYVSILVQAPTRCLSLEIQSIVLKNMRTLINVLHSRHIVPGAANSLCAMASALDRAVSDDIHINDGALVCTTRIAESIRHLCVLLLENAADSQIDDCSNANYFSRLARTLEVQNQFTAGIESVGSAQFFATYNFKSIEYCALRTSARLFHADDISTIMSAFRRSFRIVRLLLGVARYEINA